MISTDHNLQIAIVGCGFIGRKRAAALAPGQLRIACDLEPERARVLADGVDGCEATSDLQRVLDDPGIAVIIVATVNSALAPVSLAAVRAGKHVLIEKPGGLNSGQLRKIQAASQASNVCVQLGYNHRFHPAMRKARQLVDSGALGPLMFLRARYGHGGRPGYDREWRADPALSGGGELIDQGVHLIDLAGAFLGDFSQVEGHVATYYWDMKVDDNAFVSLRTSSGQTAWLHVSCTEWKNMFSMEIYGRDGKISIDGLGGSYGVERLTHYHMLPEMGPPETTIHEYPRGDDSWAREVLDFVANIQEGREPNAGLVAGIRTLEIVEQIYRDNGYPVSQASSDPDC